MAQIHFLPNEACGARDAGRRTGCGFLLLDTVNSINFVSTERLRIIFCLP
ncbi:MAG: hypothetical protein WCY29_14130 [Novosphingobium sp.]